MKLLPSLKLRKRYVVFEVRAENTFTLEEIQEEVEKALLLFLGQLGLARASPRLVKERFNPQTQRFVVRVSHKYVDELKAALTLIKSIKNRPVILRSVITSGTLKKAGFYLNKLSR